jgi:hypothetical protein
MGAKPRDEENFTSPQMYVKGIALAVYLMVLEKPIQKYYASTSPCCLSKGGFGKDGLPPCVQRLVSDFGSFVDSLHPTRDQAPGWKCKRQCLVADDHWPIRMVESRSDVIGGKVEPWLICNDKLIRLGDSLRSVNRHQKAHISRFSAAA